MKRPHLQKIQRTRWRNHNWRGISSLEKRNFDNDDSNIYLTKSEQIPSDFFKKGEAVRAVVAKVDMPKQCKYYFVSNST